MRNPHTRPAAILAVAALMAMSLVATADPQPVPAGCAGAACEPGAGTDGPQDTVLELVAGAQVLLEKALQELQDDARQQARPVTDAVDAQVAAALAKVAEARAAAEAAKGPAEEAARAKASEALQALPEKPWTSLNDGAGSGLDADRLDGLEGAQFARKGQVLSWGHSAIVRGPGEGGWRLITRSSSWEATGIALHFRSGGGPVLLTADAGPCLLWAPGSGWANFRLLVDEQAVGYDALLTQGGYEAGRVSMTRVLDLPAGQHTATIHARVWPGGGQGQELYCNNHTEGGFTGSITAVELAL